MSVTKYVYQKQVQLNLNGSNTFGTKNMLKTGIVRANEINHSARSGGIIGICFSHFFNMKVCCVFCTSINIINTIPLNCSKYNNDGSYENLS